ncbi:MAG: CpsD/CapB family tyrosine-protein kinase [Clostridia bacterium]|nr:CpsD/CapB family tyrosine-protein kinase [Clostridia bacterium]
MSILNHIKNFNVRRANRRVSDDSALVRSNTLLTDCTDFVTKEAYKTARTNIRFSLSGSKGGKKIIVTSASPGEGKTTTCLNLAIAFAQTDAKVLVIDADLRKPRIYRHLSIERENGLSDLLCGLIETKDAIKHCERHNLDCITSGQIPPNPAELLSSKEMDQLFEELSASYDYIFVDTPPVTVVTEAAAMAKNANGVIVVIRQNSTIHESIERALANLKMADAKILGYILNGVDHSAYGYKTYNHKYKQYGYRYGYGYGDKSYSYGDKETKKKVSTAKHAKKK